ncbi:AAA family ATPase [Cytobacillus oceanisediminis]|uniref:AAA+ ATPase domain-containing protein n=1 Tax=Cytobacillus oceanisediminis TaxID=665099 RepID=A0ABX3CLW6_9BACI|nr:AAA family ATPase [Cytobacillus oceanisediminis]OHX42885.1 hypothetical protein BBV17_26570 [Cytobacillus oceanisediminis]
MDQLLFPCDLLDKPVEDRISYFKEYTVAHPHLNKAFKELLDNIMVCERNEILLVYGPTGVGKSTIFNKTLKYFYELLEEEKNEDRGLIPIIGEEVISPDDGKFDWKDFYIRALEKLKEPMIEFKKNIYVNSKGILPKDNSRSTYRRSLENALIHRKPKVFLIDEAQHMTRIAHAKKLKDQMETLKSLASKSNVPIVLIGTYDILKFRNLGGQLIRRGMDVHLPRYKAEVEEDRISFKNILWMFQKHMPLKEEFQLIDHWEYFFIHSAGCVGILKLWLNRTLEFNLLKDPAKKCLLLEDYKRFALSLDKVDKIADEIIEGEKILKQSKAKESSIYLKLGLNNLEEESIGHEHVSNRVGNRKPGERNPKRDQVGLGEFENAN